MSPGRELDALVSERVMGIPVTREQGGYWPPPRPGNNFSEHEIPEYSTSIADAWKIVERIKAPRKGWGETAFFTLTYLEHGEWLAGWELPYGDGFPIEGQAETAPHAICLAALAAADQSAT